MYYYGHQKVKEVIKHDHNSGYEITVTTESGNVYYYFDCKPRIVYMQPVMIGIRLTGDDKGIIDILWEKIQKSPA